MKSIIVKIMLSLFSLATVVFSQGEILTNAMVIEMVKIGLDKQIILKKIAETPNNFDVSVNALIALKQSGVESEIIALMMEKTKSDDFKFSANPNPQPNQKTDPQGYSDSVPENPSQLTPDIPNAKQALLTARTIAIEKSSVHPSRQALEKELLKRPEWKKLNLTIVRYKESADLYIEIGRVPFSWVTHRYTFRVYDRRSGAVLAAGETTSWGSLAKNLAREIGKKLDSMLII